MKLSTLTGALLVAGALGIPEAYAQNPPAGALLDIAVTHPTAFTASTYVQFNTSFVATASSEFVSFAFREAPSYWSFDDASVTLQSSVTNLLADPGLENDTPSNVGTNFPVGWGRWIQPVDVSAIGVVAGGGNNESCATSGPHAGSYFWCDGSVEGFDGLYQQLNGLTIGSTYNISWWLTDRSGDSPTNPTIDMLVYAGTALPVGTTPIGPTPTTTPAPKTVWLLSMGLGLLGLYQIYRMRSQQA